MTAHIETRRQHSVGSARGGFGGPDTYVAVQVVPTGTVRLKCLNRETARKRGIDIIYCGDGYSANQKTQRSMLGRALAEARRIADEINRIDSD
jgi:hypothetical protein